MSKEKQIIEEMALELCRPRNIVKMIHHRTCGSCDTSSCDIYELCVDLYNAGYRKQSEGEWIDKPTGAYSRMQSWCSACGKHSGIGGIESNRHKPYCPNCGVKMKGGGE